MKSGFTLIEILVALVIVGILVGTAAVSLGAGVKSAQMADATRAVQQYAGHARAIALLKQRPVVLTIEEIVEDGVFVKSRLSTSYSQDASSESGNVSHGAGFGAAGGGGRTLTLSGQPVDDVEEGGETVEDANDPLSPEPRDFEGIHIKGALKEDLGRQRSRISVFSTADLLLRQNREQQEKFRTKAEEGGVSADGKATETEMAQETESDFSIVYEPNGRCDPYVVKIWKDGTDEDKAITLEVGRFGKVVEDEDGR